MDTNPELVCGMPVVASLIVACVATLASLCLSVVGLAAAGLPRKPERRLAICCGTLSIALAMAIALLFTNSPAGGTPIIALSGIGILFGVLTVLAGALRKPSMPDETSSAP